MIASLQIWSPVGGKMIPLSQIVSGVKVGWEDPVVVRRDRFPTITVHADPRSGLPSRSVMPTRNSGIAIARFWEPGKEVIEFVQTESTSMSSPAVTLAPPRQR
jgi:multidrug efflux pump subunit AcrB